jgi:hypothetical protein
MARPPPSDTFAGAPSSWAPQSTDGEPTAAPVPEPGQRTLFETADAPAAPSALARPARLRGRLQALLARSAALAGAAPREPRASWPDSFFDADEQP